MNDLKEKAIKEINAADTSEKLSAIKSLYLGRKGIIACELSKMSKLPIEERKSTGAKLNSLKNAIAEEIEMRMQSLANSGSNACNVKTHKLDITMPGKPFSLGRKHPITQVMNEVKSIFQNLGFSVVLGPEVEKDYYNFTALNIPPDHPSRDIQDTFYISADNDISGKLCDMVLRTHTSPVQVHVMEKQQPPVRIISPGRVYRHDANDASHSFMFHQIEGLAVDKGIQFSDLKAILEFFVKRMFGKTVGSRFRPSYFPFTEPSAEVDMQCLICKGKGCSVCKQTGWLELLGCGMVNPKVFGFVGYDTSVYTGYAFGMGIERIALLKYGIDEMRLLYENDVRFLKQF
ncbi:MAG: Phenylalanine--tRNA ligase alpha subunit [Elusimicrobia bacterium ADurb.Bin231]|nr:MAG: Phenylalanine--tRNA ligase alpha subunit [Elusimicrobia bacterium ADurb.Bin231]